MIVDSHMTVEALNLSKLRQSLDQWFKSEFETDSKGSHLAPTRQKCHSTTSGRPLGPIPLDTSWSSHDRSEVWTCTSGPLKTGSNEAQVRSRPSGNWVVDCSTTLWTRSLSADTCHAVIHRTHMSKHHWGHDLWKKENKTWSLGEICKMRQCESHDSDHANLNVIWHHIAWHYILRKRPRHFDQRAPTLPS